MACEKPVLLTEVPLLLAVIVPPEGVAKYWPVATFLIE